MTLVAVARPAMATGRVRMHVTALLLLTGLATVALVPLWFSF